MQPAKLASAATRDVGANEQSVVILVYGDPVRRHQIRKQLSDRNFDVHPFDGVEAAFPAFEKLGSIDRTVLIVNDRLADGSYADLIDRLHQRGWAVPTIITAFDPSVRESVHAMRIGAVDYIVEPVSAAQLHHALLRVINPDRREAAKNR